MLPITFRSARMCEDRSGTLTSFSVRTSMRLVSLVILSF